MNDKRLPELTKLSDLADYEVAGDSQDVRGWTVQAADGPAIGRVKDLVVDVDARRARYFEVEPERTAPNERQTTVLFPVASARIDKNDRRVVVSVHSNRVPSVPRFTGFPLTAEYDRQFDTYVESKSHSTLDEDALRVQRTPAGAVKGSTHRES